MALTHALLTKNILLGCASIVGRPARCLVPSVECDLPAAFHMQCPARRRDPRMVHMKA